MLTRSRKYIALVVVNAAVLAYLYPAIEENDSDVFDTDFVIELIAEKDVISQKKEEIERDLVLVSDQMMRFKEQLTQTQQLILKSEAKADVCEIEKNNLVKAVDEAAIQFESAKSDANKNVQACAVIEQQLAVNRQQSANLEERLEQLSQQNAKLMTDLADATREQQVAVESRELEELRERVEQLERDIENPIYLKSVYIKDRQCAPPRFEERVCVKEFLVRPEFSKTPISEVVVSIVDAQNNVISEAEFVSKRAQLMRLPLGRRGAEIDAGEYFAVFTIDDRILKSSPIILSQS